jgi:hypothetical protein
MTTHRSNIGALVAGILLIGFGILALSGQLFREYHFWSYIWPLAVIGGGLLFFFGMFAGGKSLAALAIPGSIITVSGVMLLLQNLTGAWFTWSYGWTVTLASVGLGIFIMGAYQGDEHRRQSGLKVMKVGAALFILFAVFFELIFSRHGLFGNSYAFPTLLILIGSYLLIARSGLFGKQKSSDEDKPESGISS